MLAGGRSSRFGQDKARFDLAGRPLMGWVLGSLEAADERFIVSNSDYPEFGLTTHPDLLPGGDSLSGLHTALSLARNDWVAVAACDLPMLSGPYWEQLLGWTSPEVRAVVGVGSSGHMEPLAALYHRSLLSEVEGRLRSGRLKLQSLLEAAPVRRLEWAGLEARFGKDLYLNANRLEDLP